MLCGCSGVLPSPGQVLKSQGRGFSGILMGPRVKSYILNTHTVEDRNKALLWNPPKHLGIIYHHSVDRYIAQLQVRVISKSQINPRIKYRY